MKVAIAEPHGMCTGVARALEIAHRTLDEHPGETLWCFHELVHNEHVVAELQQRGAVFVDEIEVIPHGARVLFSAHGISPAVREAALARNLNVVDATCPFVAKIHSIVAKAKGVVIIAGDKTHPEVMGIVGHCNKDCRVIVIADEQELQKELEELKESCENALIMVAQTTYNSSKWQSCKQIAKKYYTNIEICYAQLL